MSILLCGNKQFNVAERTLIMGIINVTPDSFSDGGLNHSTEAALRHGLKLLAEGADILDIGGVATSPCAIPVDEEEELRRVLPIINALAKEGHTSLSIDTSRSAVALRALDLGASWINDQQAALKDPLMPQVMKKADANILMHNQGLPGVHAGEHLTYDDVVKEIASFFKDRVDQLAMHGLAREKLIIDPGIGFGKGLKDSLTLINNMHCFAEITGLTLIGVSRKSFIGKLMTIDDPLLRDEASLGATAAAIASGAHIVRTHNVKATVEMVRVFDACRLAPKESDMKIYTKGGDLGFTDLFGGGRVLKNNPRVKAYGEIDAANSAIGMAASAPDLSPRLHEELLYTMKLLFCAGAEIATAPKDSAHILLERELENRLQESHVLRLERVIDELEAKLLPLKSFILPCGSDAASRLHNARTAVRKAESALIELAQQNEVIRPLIIQFFNRLSDYLFVLARFANLEQSCPDRLWSGKLKDEEPSHTAD